MAEDRVNYEGIGLVRYAPIFRTFSPEESDVIINNFVDCIQDIEKKRNPEVGYRIKKDGRIGNVKIKTEDDVLYSEMRCLRKEMEDPSPRLKVNRIRGFVFFDSDKKSNSEEYKKIINIGRNLGFSYYQVDSKSRAIKSNKNKDWDEKAGIFDHQGEMLGFDYLPDLYENKKHSYEDITFFQKAGFLNHYSKRGSDRIVKDFVERVKEIEKERNPEVDYEFKGDGRIGKATIKTNENKSPQKSTLIAEIKPMNNYPDDCEPGLGINIKRILGRIKFNSDKIEDLGEYKELVKAVKELDLIHLNDQQYRQAVVSFRIGDW